MAHPCVRGCGHWRACRVATAVLVDHEEPGFAALNLADLPFALRMRSFAGCSGNPAGVKPRLGYAVGRVLVRLACRCNRAVTGARYCCAEPGDEGRVFWRQFSYRPSPKAEINTQKGAVDPQRVVWIVAKQPWRCDTMPRGASDQLERMDSPRTYLLFGDISIGVSPVITCLPT